ncbi:hypothetical protein BRE01_26620 [Brevibacillus reuszeri]|uniref:Uncharacterized protein n=1 Tax=Brevibacillus reuszeri TaxID=54915 RepID=A0A0K9YLU5_9BACL|nr:hypothetical protein [Brevibacillus reuszeri]KNB69708.1 hypothetical protein ADS79_28075 [Brevibacillus reuszeri]MED1858048.1 hypothetical protein [Brevibacillus reuszeri]GED68960.1 hypothetical protein BRE01_26620 [Brevibacillus reuszeri]
MRIWGLSVIVAMLFVSLAGAGFYIGTLQKEGEVAKLQQKVLQLHKMLAVVEESAKQRETPVIVATPVNEQINKPKLDADRDGIARAFEWTDDKGTGYTYSEEQLTVLQQDSQNRDYKQVLRRFAEQELQKDIDSFQTIGSTLNPRRLLVVTTDNSLYEISMKKRSTHDQIWTVEGSNTLSGIEKPNETELYHLLKLDDADEEVQAWAKDLLETPEWKNEWMRKDGKTYVLIKSSSSESDSIELESVRVWGEELYVDYQALSYGDGADPAVINDYVLIEVPVKGAGDATFRKTVFVVE